jgi:hypothetical protein
MEGWTHWGECGALRGFLQHTSVQANPCWRSTCRKACAAGGTVRRGGPVDDAIIAITRNEEGQFTRLGLYQDRSRLLQELLPEVALLAF